MNENQKKFKDMVAMYIASEKDLTESIIDDRIGEVRYIPSFSALSDEEVKEVSAAIKSEFSIKLDKGTLIEEEGHEKWFLAKKPKLDMRYWERYKKYLLKEQGFSTNVVNSMDDILDTLTDLLGNPDRDVAYNRKGLIIGDVQSGKTSNYTGLICKAVDAGYKVVVLLTGTIEKLRQQTQRRIDEGFVGADSSAMIKQKEDGLIIGVGQYDSSVRPMVLTSTTDDFKAQNAKNLNFDLRNINGPVIFVVKKNSAVLKRLNKWLSTYNQNGTDPINHSLLVIDDEADNASVNTKADPEETPTAINGNIRKLLAMFTKSSYVGFTATPFANIFIDPENENDMYSDDLFPKDYIYSLNAPSNYTGARNIFGENADADYMLVEIDENVEDPSSIASILPLNHRQSRQVSMLPKDLKTAIAAFLIANTLEDLRGFNGNHRSMLINVSRFTMIQNQIAILVNEYLKEMQSACRNYASLSVEKAIKDPYIFELKETYEKLYEGSEFEWKTVQNQLHFSCAGIIVQAFNRSAGQNFSYEEYKDGLRVIAVGGMSLSRGLTLEGLVISYFYRNSKMYDTLMQMGRWFGYRKGYADICRIFMSSDSIAWYRHISDATDELREEVKRYEDTSLTPKDFGLRVRSDITSLLVTARNKMRSAESRTCVISLSGEVIETPDIYADYEKNEANKNAVINFVKTLEESGNKHVEICMATGKRRFEYRNIDMNIVLDLLKEIDVSPKNAQFNTQAITSFISSYRGEELKKWDIAFVSGDSSNSVDLGYGVVYNCPTRIFTLENGGKNLKINGARHRLGGKNDGKLGLDDEQIEQLKKDKGSEKFSQKDYFTKIKIKRNPLLTIYFIELKEQKQGEKKKDSIEDILKIIKEYQGKTAVGFGIGIPLLSDQATKYARYMLNKVAIQQIFEGDFDDYYDDDEVD